MSASAYGLVTLFAVISAASGWFAVRAVGPSRQWAAIGPAIAAFGALYVVGHRSAIRIGPEVEIFGWQVSLAFDVAVALVTALVVALAQRAALRLLETEQRRAGGNGLA